jgi:hypothetical protein
MVCVQAFKFIKTILFRLLGMYSIHEQNPFNSIQKMVTSDTANSHPIKL